jgi:multiple antibiotic resistance protein
VVIDPIGTIPAFIAVTAGMASGARRATALLASIVSICVLLFFLIFGQILIDALGISLLSFQVAGGIVLFLFALTMIFGDPKPVSDKRSVEHDAEMGTDARPSPAIFPLAVPSLASPGAMLAIVLLTDNNSVRLGGPGDDSGSHGGRSCNRVCIYVACRTDYSDYREFGRCDRQPGDGNDTRICRR